MMSKASASVWIIAHQVVISMASFTLPIIDIKPWLNQDPADREKRAEISATLHKACVDYGFFYLNIESFVGPSQPEELAKLARAFFGLPQKEKDKLALHNQDYARGWILSTSLSLDDTKLASIITRLRQTKRECDQRKT